MKRLYLELILIISIFVCVHHIILPRICSNLPYSVFYETARSDSSVVSYENQQISEERKRQLSEDMIIVVLTSSRRKESYLHQTLSSLHLEQSKASVVFPLVVCSADIDQSKVKENQNVTWIIPCLDGKCPKPLNSKARGNKHIEDFLLCHEAIRQDYNPVHELWLEDDVVLMDDFFSTFQSILTFRKTTLSSLDWLDVKLYKTPRLRGYAWDIQPLTELVSMALLFTLILNTICYKCWSSNNAQARILTLFICLLITLKAISRYGG